MDVVDTTLIFHSLVSNSDFSLCESLTPSTLALAMHARDQSILLSGTISVLFPALNGVNIVSITFWTAS